MTCNEKMSKIRFFLLAFIMFTSVDTLLFGTNKNKLFLYIPRILAAIGICSLPMLKYGSIKKIRIDPRKSSILLVFISLMTISSIINHENIVTFISRLFSISLGYTICRNVEKKDYFYCFDKVMTVVSVSSLILEFIAYFMPRMVTFLPQVINTADNPHYTIFLSSLYQRNNIGTSLIRASGIFWEPGAFAIYLIFALFVQLFIMENASPKKIMLYLCSLFFTFSTTGYITVSVLLLTYIISKRSSSMSNKLKVLFLVMILAVLLFSFTAENSELYSKVFSKLTSGTSSATTRYSSIFNGLKVVKDHPLFGVASQSQGYMSDYVDATGNRYSNGGYIIANTVMSYTVNYGVLFGILFVLGHFKFAKHFSITLGEAILLFLVFMLAYSGERFFSFLPFVFVFYGFLEERSETSENSCD